MDTAVVAKDKEDLERLSALVQRSAGFPPREEVTAIDLDWSVAVRRGAKPPVTEIGADATAHSNPSIWSVGKQGILTVRPKITTTCNLTKCRSLALTQPTSPSTLEQAIPPYKNRSDSPVLSSSMQPAEKVLERLVVEVPSRRVMAEALEE